MLLNNSYINIGSNIIVVVIVYSLPPYIRRGVRRPALFESTHVVRSVDQQGCHSNGIKFVGGPCVTNLCVYMCSWTGGVCPYFAKRQYGEVDVFYFKRGDLVVLNLARFGQDATFVSGKCFFCDGGGV